MSIQGHHDFQRRRLHSMLPFLISLSFDLELCRAGALCMSALPSSPGFSFPRSSLSSTCLDQLTHKLRVLALGHRLERAERVCAVHLDEEVEARLVVEGSDLKVSVVQARDKQASWTAWLASPVFNLLRNSTLQPAFPLPHASPPPRPAVPPNDRTYLEERLARQRARLGPERASTVSAELALHRLASLSASVPHLNLPPWP